VRRDIPAGTLITTFGGVTVQAWTQERAFTSFSRIHDQQHEEEGVEKFQYSVQVGSDGLPGSSAWLISQHDFPLLQRLFGEGHRELRALTAEGRAVAGLGQYAQHTCCFVHVNTHLFPLFILRERRRREVASRRWPQGWTGKGGCRNGYSFREWTCEQRDLSGKTRRSSFSMWDRTVLAIFGGCSIVPAAGGQDAAMRDLICRTSALDQTSETETLRVFQGLERQITADKGNHSRLRETHPGKSRHTRTDLHKCTVQD